MICYGPVEEERLVDICIVGMLYKYHPYLENLQIPYFTRLVEASKRTSILVRKPTKGLTSQIPSAPRKPWKQESKKVEIAIVKEPKKATKGRKREGSGITPPFFCLNRRAIQHPRSLGEGWRGGTARVQT